MCMCVYVASLKRHTAFTDMVRERERAGKRAKLIDAIVNEFTLVNAECAYRNDLTFSKGNGRGGYCLCPPVSVCVCQCLC